MGLEDPVAKAIADLRTAMGAQFEGLDTKMGAQLKGLDTKMGAQFKGLDTQLKGLDAQPRALLIQCNGE